MKATKIVLFFLALLAGTLFSLKFINFSPSPNPVLETRLQAIEINNQKLRVEIADTADTITKGLSDRDQIGSDGMLFIFSAKSGSAFGGSNLSNQPFWMKDMRFSIDLLWINNNKIIGFEKNLPIPALNSSDNQLPIYLSPSAVSAVLELPAGSIEKLNIKIGDKIIQ